MYETSRRSTLRRSKVSDLEVDTGNRREERRAAPRDRMEGYGFQSDYSRKNQEFYLASDQQQEEMSRGRNYMSEEQEPARLKHENDSDTGAFYMTDRPSKTYERAVPEDPSLQYNIHYEEEHQESKRPEEFEDSNKEQYYHDAGNTDYSKKYQEFHQDPNFELTNNIHHGHDQEDTSCREPEQSNAQMLYGQQDPNDYSRKEQEFYEDPNHSLENNVHYHEQPEPEKSSEQESDTQFIYGGEEVTEKEQDQTDLSRSELEPPGIFDRDDVPTHNARAHVRSSISGQDPVIPLPAIKKCGAKHDNPVFAEKSERICLYKKKHGGM